MSESQNPIQGFLGNLKDKAQGLVKNIGNVVEGAADQVIGEDKVDKIKEVLNTDVKEIAQEVIKDKTEDPLEEAENLTDRVVEEEPAAQPELEQEAKEQAEDVSNKESEA